MVTAEPQQTSTGQPAEAQRVAQIVAILAAGLAAQKTLELLSKTLKPLGIAADAVKVAFLLGGRRTPPLRRASAPGVTVLRPERTPALHSALSGEDTYRAAYLYAAARRVQQAVDRAAREGVSRADALRQAAERERRFHAQHLEAQARRRQVAAAVDLVAARSGVPFIDPATRTATRLVGWHATLDDRTDPACRRADGTNFPTNRPPSIGWPGAVHPNCRCRAGAPHASGRLLDPISPRRAA